MGFARDLIYREYLLKEEYFSDINFVFLSVFWGVLLLLTCRELVYKFSLHVAFNSFVFILVCGMTILYQLGFVTGTMLLVLLNVFGFFRVAIFGLENIRG